MGDEQQIIYASTTGPQPEPNGGERITYIGEHEFRIGCTCGDED